MQIIEMFELPAAIKINLNFIGEVVTEGGYAANLYSTAEGFSVPSDMSSLTVGCVTQDCIATTAQLLYTVDGRI